MKRLLIISFSAAVAMAAFPAAAPQAPQGKPVFKLNTQTVSVDVIVRDSSGKVVPGLTRDDFEVSEDGKPEQITSFAFEQIANKPKAATETADLLATAATRLKEETAGVKPLAAPAPAPPPAAETPKPMSSEELAGHRLIILLFDIASMQPDDVQRAVDSANKYVNTQMSPADMVAVATISTQLDVLSDLSSDKTQVSAALAKLGYTDGTATPPPTADTTATDEAQSSDDTSAEDTSGLDMFNNDVRLRAIKTIAESLAPIDQKKAILYFSAGMQRSGED
ncbi:MAG: VWA domain-containing protein, partial [Vicinamibacterales bacterium]